VRAGRCGPQSEAVKGTAFYTAIRRNQTTLPGKNHAFCPALNRAIRPILPERPQADAANEQSQKPRFLPGANRSADLNLRRNGRRPFLPVD
jgi:hypothetical protein